METVRRRTTAAGAASPRTRCCHDAALQSRMCERRCNAAAAAAVVASPVNRASVNDHNWKHRLGQTGRTRAPKNKQTEKQMEVGKTNNYTKKQIKHESLRIKNRLLFSFRFLLCCITNRHWLGVHEVGPEARSVRALRSRPEGKMPHRAYKWPCAGLCRTCSS